ncbi:MAG: hypothetical protein GYB37_11780 [Algicola sp.]|nr:hypothetical protein [Algicola sp.]
MKKKTFVLVIIALVTISFSSMAQRVDRTNFKAGVHAGVPFGDISDIANFEIGLDLGYHWALSELIDAGLSTGFMNVFVNNDAVDFGSFVIEGDFPNIQYLPVAAALRIYPTYDFKLGADVGYAVGVNEGNSGGLYIRPMIGANIGRSTEINISYVKISDDYDFSMAALGILFLF